MSTRRGHRNTTERQRTQELLDAQPPGSVVLDCYGHAWQSDRIYWYRAYGDDSMASSYDLSHHAPITVMEAKS